jgi:hypothetical protein
MQQNKRACAIL